MSSIYDKSLEKLSVGNKEGKISFNDFYTAQESYIIARDKNLYIRMLEEKYLKYLTYIAAIDEFREMLFEKGVNIITLYFENEVNNVLMAFKLLETANSKTKIDNINKIIEHFISELNMRYSEYKYGGSRFIESHNKLINYASTNNPDAIGKNDSNFYRLDRIVINDEVVYEDIGLDYYINKYPADIVKDLDEKKKPIKIPRKYRKK